MQNYSKITALYSRLSKADLDRGEDESYSIRNQKELLEGYAKKNNLINIKHYTDDDETGRFFDREGYVELMNDVEKGKIGTIIMKDMTRWGRNYLQVGQAMEHFRIHDVRFVAINNSIDSLNPDSLEIAPFINIMSEWYAKDISKKIRSSNQTKGMSGKPLLTHAPYDYTKNPDNKFHWLVDDEAADVVRYIFKLALQGKGAYQICTVPRGENISMPAYYLQQKGLGLHKTKDFKDPYNWTNGTVTDMLRKQEYCGDTVNFKTKKHLNDKKCKYVDRSEWQVFPDTHEAIIDRGTFESVQRLLHKKAMRRPDKQGYVHPLSGMLYCSCCHGKLHIHRMDNGKHRPTGICSNYTSVAKTTGRGEIPKENERCESAHRVEANKVMELIKFTLINLTEYVKTNKSEFETLVKKALDSQQTDDTIKQRKRITACQKRLNELDIFISKLFEQNALGKIREEQYDTMLDKYTKEHYQLEKEVAELQALVSRHENLNERSRKFISLVERYTGFEEISPTMLNEFIDRVVIHERTLKGCRTSPQKIEIHFNYIGNIASSMPEEPLTEEELQALQEQAIKRERRKEINAKYRQRQREKQAQAVAVAM
jgi:DNA invertase Pin-like site-specific DNA recombinase